MPSSKFVIESKIPESFRVQKVKGSFDYDSNVVIKEFDVDIPIEEMEWNVGLIVGSSGSGKTTIATRCFEDFNLFQGFKWSDKTIIDDFAEGLTPKIITECLAKVGFSSPPDWLKPFHVLSNGQKMRVELARLILESDKPCIYDEFTSVVDRQVAKIGSTAIQKFIRKENKQFIAVSCHNDIAEWLEPDWIYDTDKKKFYASRGSLRRPKIKIGIRKAEQEEWQIFKDFHYLTANHNPAAHKYIAEIDGQIVAWCSILHFPHPTTKLFKKLHRTVVLPDYQGIGLGSKLRKIIATMYQDQGFRVITNIASPSLINSMIRDKEWVMTRKPSRVGTGTQNGTWDDGSHLRLTASFEFIGKNTHRLKKH